MERLRDLQDRLWAEAKHSVLVVLQGIDAAGKDGTIAKVMEAFNPQGCPVTSFKVPTPEELAHDFLWRVHKRTPGKGEIGIFNRSHYEDVLVVRVHGLVAAKGLVEALRPDQRLRARCWPRAARRSSSSSCRSIATSSASASRRATTTRRSAGSSAWATSRSASSGTTTRPPSTTRCRKTSTAVGAVVRHPGQPELVPEPGGRDDPGRHDRRPRSRPTRRRRTCRPNLVIE